MNCAYHGNNQAVVNCNGCGKSLCPACDHRIKGFPFCQDCIVSGVQLLQNRYQSRNYVPLAKKQTFPLIALILSIICPGLGAAYNGQTTKALVYFGIFVGLFQMALLSKMPLFVFGLFGMWLFSGLDAWRTAKALRNGLTIDNAEDILIQRLTGNPKIWGALLVILGGLSFIYTIGIELPMKGLVSISLVLLGVYLLRDYVMGKKVAGRSFSGGNLSSGDSGDLYATNFRTGDYFSGDDYKTNSEARKWKIR